MYKPHRLSFNRLRGPLTLDQMMELNGPRASDSESSLVDGVLNLEQRGATSVPSGPALLSMELLFSLVIGARGF